MAIAIFRGRLKSLAGVAKQFWKTHLSGAFWMRPRTLGLRWYCWSSCLYRYCGIVRMHTLLLKPSDPVTLHAPVNGKVEAVYVREGDTVRRGQLLLRMSSAGRCGDDFEFAGGDGVGALPCGRGSAWWALDWCVSRGRSRRATVWGTGGGSGDFAGRCEPRWMDGVIDAAAVWS